MSGVIRSTVCPFASVVIEDGGRRNTSFPWIRKLVAVSGMPLPGWVFMPSCPVIATWKRSEKRLYQTRSTRQKQSKIFQQDVCSCGNGSSTMLTLVSPTLSHLLDDILAGYILDDCGRGGACSRTAWRAGCWFYSRTGRCRQSCHCDARLSYHRAPRSLHLHWTGLGFYRQSHHSLWKDKEAACEQINAILTDFLSRDLQLASSMDFLLQCTI